MEYALPFIWAGLLAVAVFMYIALDGFDLGLGILFPFAATDADRDVMMNSVAPVWDCLLYTSDAADDASSV